MGIKNHLDEERKTNLLIRLGLSCIYIVIMKMSSFVWFYRNKNTINTVKILHSILCFSLKAFSGMMCI